MKKVRLALISAGVALSAVTAAQAAGGCGLGFHRGPYGGCRPNLGPGPVMVGGPAVGVFYPGRGYWYGNRYYWHRGWGGRAWRYY